MFCSKCGKEQVGEAKYCSSCGADLSLPSDLPVTPQSQQGKSATGFIIGSVIFAVIALAFLPPVFGIAGIVLGYFAYKRNRTAGIICMTVSGVCMLVGFVIGAWVALSTWA